MHRGAHLRPGRDDDGQPLPPLATGIVLGLWVAGMIVLALVVVPALFSMCRGPAGP